MPKAKVHASPSDYQSLKAELDTIMIELQREDLDVDAAIAHYRRGREVIGELERYLKTAENTLSELQAKPAVESE